MERSSLEEAVLSCHYLTIECPAKKLYNIDNMAKNYILFHNMVKEDDTVRHKIWLVLFIALLLGTAGCADLSSYDLSGEIELTLKNDGLPYLEVYTYKPRAKKGSDSILESLSEELTQSLKGGFLNYYVYPFELYPKLNFTEEIALGEEAYTVQVDFAELPPEDFSYLLVYDSQGEEVGIKAIDERIHVGRDRVNMKGKSDGTKHSGYGLASFLDPYSNNEYILEIDYLIECIPMVVRTGRSVEGIAVGSPEVEEEKIEMFITAKIGNRTYLCGEYKLDGKKTVPVSVVDWNLDGKFSDEDMVRIEYKKETMFFPINKNFKVGQGKKATRYFIELETIGDDEYILSIDQV